MFKIKMHPLVLSSFVVFLILFIVYYFLKSDEDVKGGQNVLKEIGDLYQVDLSQFRVEYSTSFIRENSYVFKSDGDFDYRSVVLPLSKSLSEYPSPISNSIMNRIKKLLMLSGQESNSLVMSNVFYGIKPALAHEVFWIFIEPNRVYIIAYGI